MPNTVSKVHELLAKAAERAIFNGNNACSDPGRSAFVTEVYGELILLPEENRGVHAKEFLRRYVHGAYGPEAIMCESWREQNNHLFSVDEILNVGDPAQLGSLLTKDEADADIVACLTSVADIAFYERDVNAKSAMDVFSDFAKAKNPSGYIYDAMNLVKGPLELTVKRRYTDYTRKHVGTGMQKTIAGHFIAAQIKCREFLLSRPAVC